MATIGVSAVVFSRVREDDWYRSWIWKGVDVHSLGQRLWTLLALFAWSVSLSIVIIFFVYLYSIEGCGDEREYIHQGRLFAMILGWIYKRVGRRVTILCTHHHVSGVGKGSRAIDDVLAPLGETPGMPATESWWLTRHEPVFTFDVSFVLWLRIWKTFPYSWCSWGV